MFPSCRMAKQSYCSWHVKAEYPLWWAAFRLLSKRYDGIQIRSGHTSKRIGRSHFELPTSTESCNCWYMHNFFQGSQVKKCSGIKGHIKDVCFHYLIHSRWLFWFLGLGRCLKKIHTLMSSRNICRKSEAHLPNCPSSVQSYITW